MTARIKAFSLHQMLYGVAVVAAVERNNAGAFVGALDGDFVGGKEGSLVEEELGTKTTESPTVQKPATCSKSPTVGLAR